MKLNVAEREGKGDKGISGEQEAREAREEALLPVPSPSRAVSLPISFPLLPFRTPATQAISEKSSEPPAFTKGQVWRLSADTKLSDKDEKHKGQCNFTQLEMCHVPAMYAF